MREILGYAFMITVSVFTLIVGVAALLTEKGSCLVSILIMLVGCFNLFAWVTVAQYNLNNSKKADDK